MFSHLNAAGEANMVDVKHKAASVRRAVASARVRMTDAVLEHVLAGGVSKGDVLGVARIAGIQAAKRTSELIPLCHPVSLTSIEVVFTANRELGAIEVRATAEAFDRTGVEMEALVAASNAALTIYDMVKSADRWVTIENLQLEEKSGGHSGTLIRPR